MSSEKYLKFYIDNTLFSIKIKYIEEILHIPKITNVPLSDEYIVGISNLRGEIISVIDLKKRIKDNFINSTVLSRIIVVDYEGIKTGLLIEAINSIEEVDNEKITETDKFEQIKSDFLEGIYESESKDLVGIINLKNILLTKVLKSKKSSKSVVNSVEDTNDETTMLNLFSKKILTFKLDNQMFAIEIDYSREIIEKPDIEEIPTQSNDIIGVFNLRKEIIPILDLKSKLNIVREVKLNKDNVDKVIIFILNNNLIGLLVDEVCDVITPYKTDILSVPNTFDEVSKKFVKSIYKDNNSNEIIFILNERSILADEDLEDIKSLNKNKEDKGLKNDVNDKKIAVFKLEDEEFGIYIDEINEINRLPSITPVPKSLEFIEGIINLRGDIIPVINIRERLNLKRKEFDEFERVIIVEIEGQKTGLIVDRVTEINSIPEELFKDVPEFLKTNIEKDIIDTLVNIEEESRIITILSLNNFFSKKEKQKIKSINSKDTIKSKTETNNIKKTAAKKVVKSEVKKKKMKKAK